MAVIHSEAPPVHKAERRNFWFAASSIALLVGIVWLFWADYHRPWKDYQRQFRAIELQRTEKQISDLDAKYAGDPNFEKLESDLATEKKNLAAQTDQVNSAQAEVKATGDRFWVADSEWKEAKSYYDTAKYGLEEAREQQRGVEGAQSYYDSANARYEAAVAGKDKASRASDAAKAKLKSLSSALDDTNRKITSLTEVRTRLQRKVSMIGPNLANSLRDRPVIDFMAPSIKVNQVLLPKLFNDVNFLKIPKVDRCTTCHLAATEKGYDDLQPPFRSHPNLDLMVGSTSKHPFSDFGCTVCHEGLDRATSFISAHHTPGGDEQMKEWKKKYGWHESEDWDNPMFPTEHTEAACLKCHRHEVRIKGAPRLNAALDIIERAGCYGCHKIRGFEELRKTGPDLSHIASKVSQDWAFGWVSNPRAFRPTTWMPRFFGLTNTGTEADQARNAVEIRSILSYIWSKSTPLNLAPLPPGGDATRGREIVGERGCKGCHRIGENPTQRGTYGRDFGPALNRVGDKLSEQWIYNWVKDPKKLFPTTYMPNLRLTDREAADVAAYLVTLKKAPIEPPPPVDTELLDSVAVEYLKAKLSDKQAHAKLASMSGDEKRVYLGERLISRYGCFGCHNIPGFEKALPIGVDLSKEGSKLVTRLDFGFVDIEHTRPAWFFQKLKDPRIFDNGKIKLPQEKLKMPDFGFTDDEASKMVTLLLGFTKEEPMLEMVKKLTPREAAIEAGRRIVQSRNCRGCHIVEGTGGAIRETIKDPGYYPPDLVGEGAKVQSEWLFGFLKSPSTIRPWIQVHMPTFHFSDEDAVTIGRYFAALEDAHYPFVSPEAPVPDTQLAEGKKWFTAFRCLQCHILSNDIPPGLTAADLAPNLTMASSRLRREWVIKWLTDPQKQLPGTRMPSFFYSDGDPLMDDPDSKITAIRDYVMELGNSRSGRAAAPASRRDRAGL